MALFVPDERVINTMLSAGVHFKIISPEDVNGLWDDLWREHARATRAEDFAATRRLLVELGSTSRFEKAYRTARAALMRAIVDVAATPHPTRPLGQTRSVDLGTALVTFRMANGVGPDAQWRSALSQLTRGVPWASVLGEDPARREAMVNTIAMAHHYEGWAILLTGRNDAPESALEPYLRDTWLSLAQLRYRLDAGALELNDRTLIIVNDAGRVGIRSWGEIAALHVRHGAHVLAAGHENWPRTCRMPGLFSKLVRDQHVVAVQSDYEGDAQKHLLSAYPTREDVRERASELHPSFGLPIKSCEAPTITGGPFETHDILAFMEFYKAWACQSPQWPISKAAAFLEQMNHKLPF